MEHPMTETVQAVVQGLSNYLAPAAEAHYMAAVFNAYIAAIVVAVFFGIGGFFIAYAVRHRYMDLRGELVIIGGCLAFCGVVTGAIAASQIVPALVNPYGALLRDILIR